MWQYIPAALTVMSAMTSASGQLARGDAAALSGQRRYDASRFTAGQLRQNAGQAVAASQRTAGDDRRRADLVSSRALAVAAASGAGASDPTVVNLISDIQGEGQYRSMLSLYEGEERERQLEMQASAAEFEGEVALQDSAYARKLSRYGAASTLLSGVAQGTLYAKYGGGGPEKYTALGDGTIAGRS